VRAGGAPLYLGPLCGGAARPIGPQGIGTMPIPFRRHTEVPSKSQAMPHGLSAHGWAESAKRGGLSLGYFSLAKQRKVTRAPKAHESSCLKSKNSIVTEAPTATQQSTRKVKREWQHAADRR
jgi:hypothetical protein